MLLGEERFDLLQTLDLKLLRTSLNNLPRGGGGGGGGGGDDYAEDPSPTEN